MAVKSQADIDAGAGLALAGSRVLGTDLATSAGGKDISGKDICEEFGHGGSGTGSNINLDDYHTGSGGLVPAGTTGIASAAGATKRFQNYVGTAAVGIDSSWTMGNWDGRETAIGGINSFSEAFMYILFVHETANNRIRISYASGTQASIAVIYNSYVNYTGLGSATWSARYNVTGQTALFDAANSSCHGALSPGPLPTYDGHNSGTFYTFTNNKQFYWLARANPNQPGCAGSSLVQGNFDHTNRPGGSGLASFELKAVLGGTSYNSTSDISNVGLQRNFNLGASTGNAPILAV